MSDVIRQDTFMLDEGTYTTPGIYQLRICESRNEHDFLEQLLVLRENESLPKNQYLGCFCGILVHSRVYDSIQDGDIATIDSLGRLRVILSRRANHNTLLVTERCNNLCLFCSQPPREEKDDWLLSYGALALAAFNYDGVIGISGGEPLLYGHAFIEFLEYISTNAPTTKLHILSNGRAFSDLDFTKKLASKVCDMDITFGIPLYSVKPDIHDLLVGASGAFSETIIGLINAGNIGLSIELRFIPTKMNANELPEIVEYVDRVFSSVTQISIMNLEAAGWAKKNWSKLQHSIDNYGRALHLGVRAADRAGLTPVLFNFPLCHLPENLRSYAVKSISDWKNYYPTECDGCQLKHDCGGYFSSSRGKYHQEPRRII